MAAKANGPRVAMATKKKADEEFEGALGWSLAAMVEKVDSDLNCMTDGTPLGWHSHYEAVAACLSAAATIAEKLSELHKARATKAKE